MTRTAISPKKSGYGGNDWEMEGRMFVNWHPFKHPTLGEVEIGAGSGHGNFAARRGADSEGMRSGEQFRALSRRAGAQSQSRTAEIKDKKAGIYQVEISVENEGLIPDRNPAGRSPGAGPSR